MVIQANMSPDGIVNVWEGTADIFNKYNLPITKQSLEALVKGEDLHSLLKELNDAVGSSTLTCVEGG
ncbi:hypothetical protein D1B31_01770 [Neobacillus notoginsengisoli]|uniref:Uncharacterized protein n=1 Tax=Neobacillus notoginsengisoli TaxID=1578198 RepID=A0A417YZU1_9BACI|nr:hypothetical protein [Neobacillus notoginsengisoli]RHW43413.1 hypothetical protein D1B31_01770 [Neobacillus notoginsengisoli]